MLSSPHPLLEPASTPSETPAPALPTFAPLNWLRAGFFVALGVALLGLIILIGWKVGISVLAIVTPFAVAIVLALLLDPLVDKLEARGLSRALGVGLIFGAFLLLLVAAAMFIVPSLVAQASQLSHDGPSYIEKGRTFVNTFLEKHRKIGTIELPANFQALSGKLSAKASEMVQGSAGRAAGLLLGSIRTVVDGFVALIVTFYLLLDIDRLRARLFYLAPEWARRPLAQYAGDVAEVFSSYLRGLMIVCALYGATTMVIFYALGFAHAEMRHYALLLGVAAGFLFAVPYVGTITTAMVSGIVALVAGGPEFGAIAVGIIIVLNQIFDNVVSPRVVGGGVGLHPVITVFALVLGGELFGLPGLLLSVPMAASIQVILFRLFPKLNSPTPESFLSEQRPHMKKAEPALKEG